MTDSASNKHVLVTGGSEGIGLELGKCFAADGARVTLLSRNEQKLQKAKQEIIDLVPTGSVEVVSADVGDAGAFKEKLKEVEMNLGHIDVAVCVAGLSIPKLFKDQTLDEAHKMMQVNYWGCYYTAHILLPGMISRGSGHVCFISSMAYVSPMAGYSAYCPTKAAVRHLGDALRNELQGTGVTVSVGYPPDTKTPGFEVENTTKPGETLAISEALQDQVYTAEEVAKCMYGGFRHGKYHLPTPDFGHMMGLSLVAGLTPRPRWAIVEVILAPILVIVGLVMGSIQDRTVRKYRKAHGK